MALRGGNFNNTNNAGVGSLNLNNERGNSNNNIGGGLDYLHSEKHTAQGPCGSAQKIRDTFPTVTVK